MFNVARCHFFFTNFVDRSHYAIEKSNLVISFQLNPHPIQFTMEPPFSIAPVQTATTEDNGDAAAAAAAAVTGDDDAFHLDAIASEAAKHHGID